MSDEIVNKVAQAQIDQIDLKDYLPKTAFTGIDLKDRLWNELVLREKDFREWIRQHDWSVYRGKPVCVYCSADAIIPAWAFMLVMAELREAGSVFYGNPETAWEEQFFQNLRTADVTALTDKRVMVKGCSDIPNPNKAYVILTQKLTPVVKSLMFGEPCSAVPVFKKK